MKKVVLIMCVVATVLTSGCGRGPFRQFLRGGDCNACQPSLGRFWGAQSNIVSGCESDQCYGDANAVGTGALETQYADPATSNSSWDPYSGGTLGNAIAPPNSGQLPGPLQRGN